MILHRCCHLVVYNRSCSVPPIVPVHFDDLGGAGTLSANNQRCMNAVPLRPKALQSLLTTMYQTAMMCVTADVLNVSRRTGFEFPPTTNISRKEAQPQNVAENDTIGRQVYAQAN